MQSNQSLIHSIIFAASRAGSFQLDSVRKLQKSDVVSKGLNDFVSFVDKQSESMLIDDLSKIIPGSSFLAEESGEKNTGSEWTWIVDPLDGTTNYIHGIPLFSVSIGLLKNGKLFAGVVHEPNLNETFHAVKSEGAFLNGNPIKVTNTGAMKDSLWATGFPYHDFDKINEYMEFIQYSIRHTHGLRRLGSAAVDLVYTAAGRIDGFFEFGLNPWDVAAGALIVQEAGGVVTDFAGGDGFVFNREIIACNPELYKEFFEKFREIYF
ncbi:MAG TPA: inositol monophosphatase family protein [Bacteroidales bacterium]|nr:inositol monophosphatase family protein [Bacteroidales bacterium]